MSSGKDIDLEDDGGKMNQVDDGDAQANTQPSNGLEEVDLDVAPPLPSAMLTDSLEKSDVSKVLSKAAKVEIETMDECKPPDPFKDDAQKKKILGSCLTSSNEQHNSTIENNSPMVSNDTADDVPEDLPTPSDTLDIIPEPERARASVGYTEREEVITIPEAVLVEHIDRVPATPVIPFWERPSTRLFVSIICLLAAVLAITFSVVFSRDTEDPATSPLPYLVYTLNSPVPSTSSSPSAPTVSPAPSLSPSAYLDSSKSHKKVVVDESNMVVVSKDWRHQYSLFVEFFSMSPEGWDRVDAFSERGSYYGHEEYDVTIIERNTHSNLGVRNTTILEFPNDCYGSAIIYEQDISGKWARDTDSRCDETPPPSASGSFIGEHVSTSLIALSGVIVYTLLSL